MGSSLEARMATGAIRSTYTGLHRAIATSSSLEARAIVVVSSASSVNSRCLYITGRNLLTYVVSIDGVFFQLASHVRFRRQPSRLERLSSYLSHLGSLFLI